MKAWGVNLSSLRRIISTEINNLYFEEDRRCSPVRDFRVVVQIYEQAFALRAVKMSIRSARLLANVASRAARPHQQKVCLFIM